MESISSEFVQLSARTFGTSTKHSRTSPKVSHDGWRRQATRRVTRCTKASIVGAPGVAKITTGIMTSFAMPSTSLFGAPNTSTR
ncbi:hypothetical protein FOTG_18842 [Fusarium oxysporum f. sp. vasinfectum 25433]|uniref:Uncharacterized protein n=1 Tax=Fusarium oxysporum f. sp. vasinfectum 25433 TaxID=1089449 RepID=X0KVG5_FUSOX|nr:hypothetical protein FOTG_18842 [Fusarium oxysporum f. sp. vasinfectum 25433]